MKTDAFRSLSRRELLASGLAAAGALAIGQSARADEPTSLPYGPFKMGLQSYSLRHFKADKALEMTRDLGLGYWEAYPNHVPMTADARALTGWMDREMAVGVKVVGYGVVPFSKDHEKNKAIFTFAKAAKIDYISADPSPDSFESLDRLTEEFGIPVGIHNHGPGHRYATIEGILSAIKDHSPRIGCCIDTGHFLRSGIDPVDVIEAFGDRIYGTHLKDVKATKTFTLLGEGDLRLKDYLKALAARKYKYLVAIEYEENESMPIDDIKACLTTVKKAIASMG